MGNRPILSDMILRFPVSVHLVMVRLLSFLLISWIWTQCVGSDLVYILAGVVSSPLCLGDVDLELKYMAFVNDVDQRAASSV